MTPPTLSADPAQSITVNTLVGPRSFTVDELQRAVAGGAKFVVFQYCISILILSFKRSSDVFLVLPSERTFGKSIPYCLISLFAGWWGIPWGPIWTVWTMAVNLGGGKNLTNEIMASLGPSR